MRNLARTVWALLLPLTAASCSLLIDDADYACQTRSDCLSPSEIVCVPHRLCGDNKSLCVDGTVCQPLINEEIDCNYTYPADPSELGEADIFPIGVIAQWPSDGDPSGYGVPTTRAVEVAVSNINAEGGLRMRGAPERKLLAIACNEAPPSPSDSLSGVRPFLKPRVDHLVEQLGVSAIIGGSTSGATRQINRVHLENSDVLLLSPTATDDVLPETLRSDAQGMMRQLFWRTVAPDAQQVPVLIKAHERARAAIAETMEAPDALNAISVYDADANSASRNLQNLFSQMGSFDIPAITFKTSDKARRDAVVKEIVDVRRPRFILAFGTGEFVSTGRGDETQSMLADVEASWNDEYPRPWYILTEGNRGSDFGQAIMNEPTVVDRVIGAAPGPRTSPLYKNFSNEHAAYFQTPRPNSLDDSITPGHLAESGYDAVFLLAYAALKASRVDPWPRGPALATAIDELHCTDEGMKAIEAGGERHFTQVNELRDNPGGCFNFEGASGPLDYKPVKPSGAKEPQADFALWCLGNPSNAQDATVNMRHFYSLSDKRITAPDESELSLSRAGWCARDKP